MISSSCKKFLTIEPGTETTASQLFASKQGYTDALVGIYMNMRKNYSPATFLTSGGTDFMAQLWYAPATTSYNLTYKLNQNNYATTEVDDTTNPLFLNQYNIILNANTLLNALSTQHILEERLAGCTEGEALAIRAFAHFDLIRLFGPMPANPGSKAYLPYVTIVDRNTLPYDTYSSYMAKLSEDLNKAEQLLMKYDPIYKYGPSSLNTDYAAYTEYPDLFWYYRQNRMNYYAVLGLQARVKLWMGDKANAAKYAKMVIDAVDPNGAKKFTFGTERNLSSKNYVFFTEHLFGLNIENFDDSRISSGSNAQQFIQQPKLLSDVYQGERSDLRYKQLNIKKSPFIPDSIATTKKYADMLQSTSSVPNYNVFSVPLIRLSEMYLIMIECSPIDLANTYYATYRAAKGVPAPILTASTLQPTLIREYIKEFYAEGQVFFMYKRLGVTNMLWSDHVTGEAQYVLPLPSKEVNILR